MAYTAYLFCTYKSTKGDYPRTNVYGSASVPENGSWSSTISTKPDSPPDDYEYFSESCGYGLSACDPARGNDAFDLDLDYDDGKPFIMKLRIRAL